MSNLPLLESRPHPVSARAGAAGGLPLPARRGPSVLEEPARRWSAEPSDPTCAPGAADLMVQVIRAWETDGGAVVGGRMPAVVAGDAAGDRDGEDVVTPVRLPRGAAAADVAEPAEVDLDLMVGIVTGPGGTRVEIAVRGELDLATVPQLRVAAAGACRAEVGRAGAVVLMLDLTDVTFMDSAALHALADIDLQVARRGWSLRVAPPATRGPRRLLLFAARRRWLPRWRTGLAERGSGPTQRADAHPAE